jgi:hypothetical protein
MHTKHLLGESLPLLAKGQAIALRRFLLAVYATGVGNFKHWSTDWCRSPNFPQSLVFGKFDPSCRKHRFTNVDHPGRSAQWN